MNEEKKIDLELPSSVAQGTYSNLAVISHSPNEFVIDFLSLLPGMPKPQVVNRIIMTPSNAMGLLKALEENISKYQSEFSVELDNITNNPISVGKKRSNS